MTIDIERPSKRPDRSTRWIWLGMFGWALTAAALVIMSQAFIDRLDAHQTNVDNLSLEVERLKAEEQLSDASIGRLSLKVEEIDDLSLKLQQLSPKVDGLGDSAVKGLQLTLKGARQQQALSLKVEDLSQKLEDASAKASLGLVGVDTLMKDVAQLQEPKRSLRLVNDEAKVYAELSTSAAGFSGLRLTDKNGTVRAYLGMDPDGTPFLHLRDKNGTTRAVLGVTATKASITGAISKSPEGALTIFDANNRVTWRSH